MSRSDITRAKTVVVCNLIRAMPDKSPIHCASMVDYIQRVGAGLLTRYIKASNEPVDNNYIRITELKEAALLKTAREYGIAITNDENERRTDHVYLRLQDDCRAWPVVLYINGSEHRLGGK